MLDQFTAPIVHAITRGWANFVARPGGPLNFRFFFQPAIGILMAVRAGVRDAREDRPVFLWQTVMHPAHRKASLHSGWKDISTAFWISAIFDSVYQVMIHHAIYLLELLFTVSLLVILPYVLLRGPVNRAVRLLSRGEGTARPGVADKNASTRSLSEADDYSPPSEKDWQRTKSTEDERK